MNEPLIIGEWMVNPALDEIARDGQVVKLEPRLMSLLLRLAESPGAVVSIDELLESVWRPVVVSPESVYQYVAQLRRALGDSAGDPRYIATVVRKGYRLVAPVSRATPGEPLPDALAAGAAPPGVQDAAQDSRVGAQSGRRAAAGLVALIVLAALAALALFGRERPVGGPAIRSVSVLPLAAADSATAAMADRLSDELISALADIHGLTVVARGSSFAARERGLDAAQAGRLLGVSHVITGAVHAGAAGLRVTLRLVDVERGAVVWTATDDVGPPALGDWPRSAARQVAYALRIRLDADATQRFSRRPSRSPQALEEYFRGQAARYERTLEAAARAVGHFQRAVELDSTFALAHVGLAGSWISTYVLGGLSAHELRVRAGPPLERAIELDPELGHAYAMRGSLYTHLGDGIRAERDLRRAIALNPNSAGAQLGLGILLEEQGRINEALEAMRRAVVLDPLDHFAVQRECGALQMAGQYALATERCNHAIELQPASAIAHWVKGIAAAAQGRTSEAISHYDSAMARPGLPPIALLQAAVVRRDAGDADGARDILSRGASQPSLEPYVLVEQARLLLSIGNRREAAGLLESLLLSAGTPADVKISAAAWLSQLGRALPAGVDTGQADSDIRGLLTAYQAHWGFSPATDLVSLASGSGDEVRAARVRQQLRAELERMSAAGLVSHGLDYLLASVAALEGDRVTALRHLEAAVRRGWRRTWWARIDPAFGDLRQDPEFVSLIERVERLP